MSLKKICSYSRKLTNYGSLLKAKPDLNTTLPVRQTASIFKQPVTKVTNHPNNKVKTDPQKAVEQPKQVSQKQKKCVKCLFVCFLMVIKKIFMCVCERVTEMFSFGNTVPKIHKRYPLPL